jgi:DNA repair protein RecN (Recombination protein N)
VLLELRLENYAVIDNAAVEFGPGLNLLTGETGAGKSILIDALALLLGGKASSEVIRTGADRAVVAAVFELEGASVNLVARILEQNGIDAEDSSIILRREIAAAGRGRVFINSQPATVAVLKQLAPHLAVIHAQNESLLSFDGPARLTLLDVYAGLQVEAAAAAYAAWHAIRGRIEDSAMSRTGCAWSSCGVSNAARLKKLSCIPARMSAWKPKSGSWPTPRKSTARP